MVITFHAQVGKLQNYKQRHFWAQSVKYKCNVAQRDVTVIIWRKHRIMQLWRFWLYHFGIFPEAFKKWMKESEVSGHDFPVCELFKFLRRIVSSYHQPPFRLFSSVIFRAIFNAFYFSYPFLYCPLPPVYIVSCPLLCIKTV